MSDGSGRSAAGHSWNVPCAVDGVADIINVVRIVVGVHVNEAGDMPIAAPRRRMVAVHDALLRVRADLLTHLTEHACIAGAIVDIAEVRTAIMPEHAPVANLCPRRVDGRQIPLRIGVGGVGLVRRPSAASPARLVVRASNRTTGVVMISVSRSQQ